MHFALPSGVVVNGILLHHRSASLMSSRTAFWGQTRSLIGPRNILKHGSDRSDRIWAHSEFW